MASGRNPHARQGTEYERGETPKKRARTARGPDEAPPERAPRSCKSDTIVTRRLELLHGPASAILCVA
jgi:hypothetical protein